MDIDVQRELNKQYYRDRVVWHAFTHSVGGQHCGIRYTPERLICDELDFSIEIGFHRSRIKNREIAMVLFELFLDEVILK